MSEQPTELNSTELQGEKKRKKSKLTDEMRTRIQDTIVVVILWITIIGIFISAIGGVWAIGDVFSTEKFTWFLNSSLATQLFISGLILLGIFFLVIFLVVLYRRGKRSIVKVLFKGVPEEEMRQAEEYPIAKVIAAGGLLSFCLIFIGLITALIQIIIMGENAQIPEIIQTFIQTITGYGGAIVLFIGIVILIFDGLVYGMIYTWENGYYFVINKILMINQKIEEKHVFSKKEQVVGKIVFLLCVLELVGVVFGIVWAIIESITSDWGSEFRAYIFGFQLSFYGIFGSLLFVTLIFSMFFYKRGNQLIMTGLFVQKEIPGEKKENISARIIGGGILVAISLMFIGLLIWIISLIIQAAGGGGGSSNFVDWLRNLPGGLSLLLYSGVLEVFTILALLFIFFLHNGYVFAVEKILHLERALDEGIDQSKVKAETKKTEKKRLFSRKKKQTEET